MSPEQVRGRGVDKRSDIWAFGCVLYELLTGRAAFARATIADTISAILSDEPEWSRLPINTPASLRQLLQLCLTKDPRRRLRDIGDARLDGHTAHAVSAAVIDIAPRTVQFQRLSDFTGVNEAPAISPDGRMFSVVNAAILEPLGYPRPEQLQFLTTRLGRGEGGQSSLSPAEYWEYTEINRSFSVVGAFLIGEVNLAARDRPRRVTRATVNAELLEALGVQPTHGRWFRREETREGGPALVMAACSSA